MTVSVFDLFTIGIGPSSSHTVGPMRAALTFARSLEDQGLLDSVAGVRAELFGSLGATGHGHGSVRAVVLGLSGAQPETVDPAAAVTLADQVAGSGSLALLGHAPVRFDMGADVILHRRKRLEFHSNGMRFAALDALGRELTTRTYYSVGGGFVLGADEAGRPAIVADPTPVPYPFAAGDRRCHRVAGKRRHAGQRASSPGFRRGHGRAAADLGGHA
jgi:L-serine dehydratase